MIDGIRLETDEKNIIENDVIGEFHNGKVKISNLIIELPKFCRKNAIIRGSIHKYFNDGKHNKNDFHLSEYQKVSKDLYLDFDLDDTKTKITTIELGANIKVQDIEYILSSVAMFQWKEISTVKQSNFYLREFNGDQFKVKIYTKAKNILRFEVVLKKSQEVQRVAKGCYCRGLYDLTNSKLWKQFTKYVLKRFDQLTIFDCDNIDLSKLTDAECREITKKGHLNIGIAPSVEVHV